jgi:hypothetical protein
LPFDKPLVARGLRGRGFLHLRLALLAAAALVASAAAPAAETRQRWLLSYEVLSSVHALSRRARSATYGEKERLTRAVLVTIVPQVAAAMDRPGPADTRTW